MTAWYAKISLSPWSASEMRRPGGMIKSMGAASSPPYCRTPCAVGSKGISKQRRQAHWAPAGVLIVWSYTYEPSRPAPPPHRAAAPSRPWLGPELLCALSSFVPT